MKTTEIYCYHCFDRLSERKAFPQSARLHHFYELDQKYFPNPWEFTSWGQVLMASDHELSLSWVEDEGTNIVGLCLFLVNLQDQFAHLVKIFVLPTSKQLGLGSFLLKAAQEHLISHGIRQFYLEVEQSNSAAIALYLKHGYLKIHHRRDFYGPGRGADIMELRV